MELTNIKDAFDRVTKKQKLSCSKTQEGLDQIIQEIGKALTRLQEVAPDTQIDHKLVLAELMKMLQEIAPLSQLEIPQKDLNAALSKYPKALEKTLNPDISKAYRNIEFDTDTVNQIIASHFYQQGLFDIGDCFLTEAGKPDLAISMRKPFEEMYQILEAMKRHDLGRALTWAVLNSDNLKRNGSDLALKLHSLHFLEMVRSGNSNEALNYARSHFTPFAQTHMQEIQKLMGCLVFTRKLDRCPYAEFLSQAHRDEVAKELTKQYCNLLGQSYESPLSVTVAAGVQALPPLLKFMTVMAGKKQEWQTMEQLPVPVELDKEFQFHSIFVCPVSKEQSTDDNPAMLMPCGHVLCKQSINKMSKNSSKFFKCPYCPTDIDASLCRQLHF